MRSTCLYFAYGSNMHLPQMRERCPSAEPLGVCTLAGYRLAFVGTSRLWGGGAVATILPAMAQERTAGVLYRITDDDLLQLDLYEGHPRHYRRQRLRVQDAEGYSLRAHVYVLRGKPGLPAPAYYWRIADAYTAWGLDPWPLDAALEAP